MWYNRPLDNSTLSLMAEPKKKQGNPALVKGMKPLNPAGRPKGSVNKLAKIVYKNLKKSYKKIYYPSWWVLIFIIIKILPFSFIRYISKFLKAKT